MNQEKFGKFIKEVRKKNNFTGGFRNNLNFSYFLYYFFS